MSETTKSFEVIPWIGGINTSKDPALIGPNELTKGDNIIMGVDSSKQRRTGTNFDWDSGTDDTDSIIGLHDFWFGVSGKSQFLISLADDKSFYSYTVADGTRASLTDAGTAYPATITTSTMVTFNNRLIICVDGASNLVKQIDATGGFPGSNHITDLGGTPPEASIVEKHLGRLFMNDKTNLDRLHYSETSDAEVWGGTGDSGAIDIRPGDGDPEGITAIKKFKGDLIVFKSNHIYRVRGSDPETFLIEDISSSIGCIGPNAVAAIDGNDLIFISKRGVHSLVATDTFGDIQQTYVSRDIQKTFNDGWTQSRRQYAYARYLPSANSVAFAVTDSEFSSSQNRALWFYHIVDKTWYRWPSVSCQSLVVVDELDRQRWFLGTNITRVARTLTDSLNDTNSDGSEAGVAYEVDTGFMLMQKSPMLLSAFKNVGLLFRAQGTYSITVKVRIDNLPEQTVTFTDTNPGDLLGSTFILGQSELGVDNAMAVYLREIQGCGKYIRLRILMSGATEQLDLQGFLIEYEEAGVQKEVIDAST